MKYASLVFAFILSAGLSFGQHMALSATEAQANGISLHHLDSMYKSAVHSDTSLAVCKTESEQETLKNAYYKLLQDFGNFLSKNNFKWDRPTRSWNRIYFNADGTIDYFLYNFPTKDIKPENRLSADKERAFGRLLHLFIQDYRFSLTANTRFAQCSPVTYSPD